MPARNTAAHIRLVEEVVLREVNERGKKQSMTALVLFCRYRINWRVNVHSVSALLGIWTELKSLAYTTEETGLVTGVTDEVILSMVNEWLFRMESVEPYTQLTELADSVVESIFWTSKASALPDTIATMTPDSGEVAEILEHNPWVLFLILLGMSDCVSLIAKVDV